MMTHHTLLVSAGVLLAALGTSLSGAALAQTTTKGQSPSSIKSGHDGAKPTTPSRNRATGGGTARMAGDPAAVPDLDIQVDNANRIVIRDLDADRVILDTRTTSLWSRYGTGQWQKTKNWVQPTVRVHTRPGGVDIDFEFRNGSSQPALLGEFRMPGMNLAPEIRSRNFHLDASETTISRDAGGKDFHTRQYAYPAQLYAPVAMLADANYTIGVSLNYPVLDYQHSLNVQYSSIVYPKDLGTAWLARFRTNMAYEIKGEYQPEGMIQPGETRRYTMSVRILNNRAGDHPNRWLQAFAPYREHFRSLYGGVQYQRDPRAIQLLSMANRAQNSDRAKNPRSYNFNNNRAPDRFGFEPWANYITARMNAGVQRFNLVGLSGAQWDNEALNAPFLVATPFFNEPAMAKARQSIDRLQDLKQRGAELNFWWGRSAQVMFGWDTGNWANLDPDNATHRAAARAELDAARLMGASGMGLDAFKHMPTWDAYGYLKSIRQQYPDMDLVIEPMPADVLHSLAPGFLFMNRTAGQERFAAESPHVLADFLLPGHEIWGIIRSTPFYEQGLAKKGSGVPDAALRQVAERAAANGYSPVIFGEPDVRSWKLDAAESWLASVPADLRD